ncbi:MAG: aldo/keto reductase [Candidatus Omnitrophota bacterium]
MEYRKIGRSNLEVSAVCLGSWVFGGDCWGEVDDARSERVVREAVEKGINFIDTAPVYGDGHAERIIGRALHGISDKVIIATKCGLEGKGASIKHNLSAAFIKEEVENSLKRLGVDVIDLYQCHWPDPNTPLEETFSTLKGLIEEGKIRHIGVSNFDRTLLERASSLAPIISDQMQYSLLDRGIERDLIPFCEANGISVLSYGPLAGGILTGKYKKPPNFPKGDARSFFYKYYREPAWTKAMELVDILGEIAEKRHVPIADIAISWVLSCPEVASCIVGCRTPQQLDENIRAAGIRLKEEELAKIRG